MGKGQGETRNDAVEVSPNMEGDTPEEDKEAMAPDQNAQAGVQKIEAVTLVWTKRSLAALLIKYAPFRPISQTANECRSVFGSSS